MLGLFGTLSLGARSLLTQQQGVSVAGQNLANVNNPGYARQRLILRTSLALQTANGSQGTGVEAGAITQVRDAFLDQQILSEGSISGFLQSQQRALQYAQGNLGEQLGAATGTDANGGATGGLTSALSGLFNAFQDLSASPSSISSRQAVISQAQQLAGQFNQVDQRLGELHGQLDQSVQTDVSSANQLLSDIAGLNKQIASAEAGAPGTANDLRDLRQEKMEELSKLVSFQSATTSDGALHISVGGQLLVAGSNVQDTLQTYDAGGGQLLVRTATGGTPLALTGGSIQGTIDARDTTLKSLQDGINTLASQLITQVNTVYRSGYDLNGNTGADFFTGTNASDIAVNSALASDPASLQASGAAGAAGDSQVAVRLAQLADAKQAGLGNRTFSENYNGTITGLGFALDTVNSQLDDQQSVQNMLLQQRTSVSGVSIDEEMTDLVKFQRAFQASAKLVSTVDDMLAEVVNLKQ